MKNRIMMTPMGNIRDSKVAEDILAKGDADIIGMGRGLIADPEWVNKVEFGDICDIRKCISCNIGCAGNRIGFNRPIRCTVNPSVLEREHYKKQHINKPCNVIVIGGAVGLDVAEYFAPKGAQVTIVEMMPVIGNGIDPVSKTGTFALMEKYNVRQMTNTALKEVCADSFLLETKEGTEELKFDYGFVCLGMKAVQPVLQDIKDAFENENDIEVINIGDSVRARRIIEGTEEGRNILNTLEKRGYL